MDDKQASESLMAWFEWADAQAKDVQSVRLDRRGLAVLTCGKESEPESLTFIRLEALNGTSR